MINNYPPSSESRRSQPKGYDGNSTPIEQIAKDKLLTSIYEYLTHIGATKTAESLKNECFPNQNLAIGESPGILSQWFILFWELYNGDMERRDKNNATQEAKAFHDFGFVQPTSFRPGGPGYVGPPPPMGMPPSDAMMSPYFRPPNPYCGPRFPMMPQNPNQMMYPPPPGSDPRAMAPARLPRMPSSMNFNARPPRYGAPYMDAPPGGYPYGPPDQMPPPSSMTPSTSVPTSMPMNGQMPMSEAGPQALPSLNSTNPLAEHSPSHHIGSVHGQNGNGTPIGPGSQHAPPGAPASVQSQQGQPGSVVNPATSSSQQPSQQPMNPSQGQPNFGEHGNMMDFQTEANNNPNSHENLEIKKIREGLLDDFPNES